MANLFDDLIPNEGGKKAGFDDLVPAKPVRFMEEPTAVERFLAGVKLPKWMENLRGTAPVRVLQGMADPMIGAMQTAANVLPDSTGIPQAVNKKVADLEADYESQRKAMGSEGVDAARLIGNVASPTNALIALKAPVAATTGARIWQGGAIGAGTAAMEPVDDAAEGGFWGKKGGQVVGGAVAGGLLTPVLGKVADKAAGFIRDRAAAQGAAMRADEAIDVALKDLGQTIHDVPPNQLAALRAQVQQSLESGKELDAAAALRKADFDALDMPSLRGQITRDPMQFAAERDLRGVRNVGEPITNVLETQGKKLQERLATDAKDAYGAGSVLTESLKKTDDVLDNHVSALFREARASAGKDLDVPLQGLAQDYARVLGDFGDKVPGAVRAKFAELGLDPSMPSNQRKVFTLEDANKLQKVINQHVGPDTVTNRALAELRGALKGAITAADPGGGPFAPAMKAAAERFKLHDAVPALKAAADGSVAPDDFVRRFIVNGKTDDVKGLAKVLSQADPTAYQEARAQIGDVLKRAAFGENPAGDSPFSPSRYMKAIRQLGPHKLGAFFSAEEVADIMRVGRVGAYIHSVPEAAAPNFSNSGKAVVNLLRRVPGMPAVVDVASRAAGAVNDGRAVRRAVAAEVPATDLAPSETRRNALRALLAAGAAGAGAFAGR